VGAGGIWGRHGKKWFLRGAIPQKNKGKGGGSREIFK